jgi:Tfp pilus assembly protein PilX
MNTQLHTKYMRKNSVHRFKSAGYTLLFAMLLTTLVLSIGVSILTIARKEVILTGSSRESHRALLAADSGLECAVYWNRVASNFPGPDEDDSGRLAQINCQNLPISINIDDSVSAVTEYSWTINRVAEQQCTLVKIIKNQVLVGSEFAIETTYESRGYNTACSDTSNKRVERALRYSI